ncbi:MAG: bifunctional 2-C-methyl-D-erythritol 4-phosphate cytidylyltransferase/2-C-methyl-D-erythritol 2,4-cyclodiphosphate synthase [Pseudomonadota bacterium]
MKAKEPIVALLVAAGKGTRLGGPIPKQYQRVGDQPVIAHAIRAMLRCQHIDHVVCAISPDARDLYFQSTDMIRDKRVMPPVDGGDSRAASVRNALRVLATLSPRRVLIHDAARPFISSEAMNALCTANDAAILAEPVVDALWRSQGELAHEPVSRAGLWRAQTPQAFPFEEILAAHQADANSLSPALDDAETYRRAGGDVRLLPGETDNFKITTAADMARAERLIAQERQMEVRTGHGFDVHRFRAGDHVWLCGVKIPHTASLEGHSDADVGLHALADAIYGALGEGDIGTHFPPTDPKWKAAESHVFLTHAAKLLSSRNARLVNADITLLCEAPKIKPHSAMMRERLAQILEVSADRLSVKATTMERMGAIGREEGMGCIATATIELPR